MAKKKRKPTPRQLFAAALAVNERASLRHAEASLDGALACVLSMFDDKLEAADVIACAVADAFRLDAEVEKADPIAEEPLAEAVFESIASTLSGNCPCCGGPSDEKVATVTEKTN